MRKFLLLLLIFCLAVSPVLYAAQETVSVVSFEGDVKVLAPGEKEAVSPKKDMVLEKGTKITTGKGGYLEMTFDESGDNILKVEEETEVVIKIDGVDKVELVNGELFALIQNLGEGEEFRVKTPCATCGARGTAWKTMTDGQTTDVSVVDDKVFVRGFNKDGTVSDKVFWVNKGYRRSIKKFRAPGEMKKIPTARFARMKREMKPLSSRLNKVIDKRISASGLDKPRIERVVDRQEAMDKRTRTIDIREDLREKSLDQQREKKDEPILRKRRRRPPPPSGGTGSP